MSDENCGDTRPHTASSGSSPGGGWLTLPDDELIYRIEALPEDHQRDDALFDVVRSARHFFVRQEAAKRIRDRERLKQLSDDRHIGQILVRVMTRVEDVAYLERLIRETRHLEVRKAAEAQLDSLKPRPDPKRDPHKR